MASLVNTTLLLGFFVFYPAIWLHGSAYAARIQPSDKCIVDSVDEDCHGTLEVEFDISKEELQSLKDSVNSKLDSIIINQEVEFDNLKEELQSLKDIMKNQGCPAGFFQVDASGQCFKYDGQLLSWWAAKAFCEAEGHVLAHPYNPLALQSYIVNRYDTVGDWSWVGARGDGSYVRWSRDATVLSSSHPGWFIGHPDLYTSSSYCLLIMTTEWWMKHYPGATYYMTSCTANYHTICELVRE